MRNTKLSPAELGFSGATWEKSPFSGGSDSCVEFGEIGRTLPVQQITGSTRSGASCP
ncbi:DUF397 domain-containing protein [Streptomyces avermitilis]